MVLKYIKDVVNIANKHNIDCGICGEMAGDLNHTESLLKTGIKDLSVSPHYISELKEKIRGIDLSAEKEAKTKTR